MPFDWSSTLAAISAHLGTAGGILLSIASGAGGAALLDLWWKPGRDRRNAARVILSEVLTNADLCLLQSHARWSDVRRVPVDFRMELQGWDAVADKMGELPAGTLKSVMLLYSRYRNLNSVADHYSRLLDRFNDMPANHPKRASEERTLVSAIDVFHTSVDNIIEHSKKLAPALLRLAAFKEPRDDNHEPRDYGEEASKLINEREARIRRIMSSGSAAPGSGAA